MTPDDLEQIFKKIDILTTPTILCFTIFWQWRKHADAAFKHMHTLIVFACARAGVQNFHGARDLALRLANKRTTSLLEGSDTEYR